MTRKIRPSEFHCLAALFERQCLQTPASVAVKFGNRSLTYSELNSAANRIAHYLRNLGVKPDGRVGIAAERSVELVAGILGIIKSGAAYVPFDASYPAERIELMLQDSGVEILLVQEVMQPVFKGRNVKMISLESDFKEFESQPADDLEHVNQPDDLAYILFTSGSTGKPKGVGMIQNALVNLVQWQNHETTLDHAAKTLQFAPISFDVSFQELFTTWTTGGTIILIEDNLRLNAIRLLEYINAEKIERLFLPFIALQHLAEVAVENEIFPGSLADVITAGEQLRITRQVSAFFKSLPGCRLHNHYGPTETHVCTAYTLPEDVAQWNALPPIGKPVSNTEIFLLDENLKPVPKGNEGELYVGGQCLARGYVNRDDLTAERFLQNPFGEGRIYKTGDLARELSDGNLEYLGRQDGQVKIRGYRIELGEIEVALGKHPAVNQCVVIAREDEPGDKRLVAYVIPSEKNNFHANELRRHLKSQLPDYMMPSAFMALEVFPRTPSGKIDKRSLPPPEQSRPELDTLFAEPKTVTEKRLANLWSKLLRIDKVGIHDNFFDLGGNSLLALQMIARLKADHALDLPVVKIYQHPDIASIARYLDEDDLELSVSSLAKQRFKSQPHIKSSIENVEDGIAIIGIAGRFPGAANVDEFWNILKEGKETTRFFSKDELDRFIPPEIINDPLYVPARGVLDNADQFDAAFFGVNPKLAELMDPQQRIFLEVAWESLENAGYCSENFQGMIGVFAGMGNNTYYSHNVFSRRDLVEKVGVFQVMTANEKDYIATRIAYEMNLGGPALSIHTACSTSLVAVAVAFENLVTNKCDMALAGGISITSPVNSGHIYNEGGMFSSDGHTRTFDSKATGTVFSDGCGIVVLKRFKDAVRDGDSICAVIRGVALNNDGSDKASFTAPSVQGQAMAIAMAQANAGVEADSITYIEAHGTATPLGDPIEIEALTQAFGETKKKQYCAVGSVKSNFGHLTPAAGVTGLIKTVLALQHRQIPATLHFEKPNLAIDFANSPFFVNNKLINWETDRVPRRAGVSSFGVGGTNVHVVVEEAPKQELSGPSRPKHLFLLSAKSEPALEKATQRLINHIASNPEVNLSDAAYTLQTGRKSFSHRRFIVCDQHKGIDQLTLKKSATRVASTASPEIVFMFPGQGSQYVNMGQNLYRDEIIFRQAVDECALHLERHLGKDIRAIMHPVHGREEEAENLLKQTVYTQASLFTMGYSLARLWQHWGIQPSAMIGHSIGEYAAACIAGVMSLQDACFLVAHRGMMMQQLPPGSMLTVRLPASETEKFLNSNISIAAINGPQLCVVSGETPEIEKLRKTLEEIDVVCKLLVTSHAFHSPMMESILKPFEEKVKSIKLNKPAIPFVSTVTAQWITPHEAVSPSYWSGQIRASVRFAEGIQALWKEDPSYVLLELGPRTTAATLARQQATDLKKQIAISSLGDTAQDNAEWSAILFAIGQLWLCGATINWQNFYALEKRKRIALPTYPFERKRFWIDPVELPTAASSPFVNKQSTPHQPELISTDPGHFNLQQTSNKNMNNRKEIIIAELKEMFEESSGIEMKNAGEDISFLEMGLDSLFLTQSALSVSKKYGVKVTFRQLNEEFSTLGSLAAHLDKNLPAEAAPARVTSQPESVIQNTVRPAATPALSAEGMSPMQMMMMQQMQMMQMMMQQMHQPPVASVVQQHIEKSIEIKAHTKKEDLSENEKAELAKPFGAIARIEKSVSGELNPAQKKWLEDFTEAYNKKTQKSKSYCQEHRSHLADPRVVTGFKPLLKELIYQVVVNKSKGVNLWDLDGNRYVDVLNGFGSNFFGWNSDMLTEAWKKQLDEGVELGPQTPLAGECAKLICELTGYDRAGFCNTGSEAVLGAMRIARTYTGKNTIVCFNGSYHGINDEVIVRGTKKLKSFPAAAGIPAESVQNMLVLDYGTDESLQIIRERMDEIAAVLIEPVQSRRADFQPKAFIHEVRKITQEAGALMIFDEVITGFRLHLGGAQEYYDVKADLSTYGKVIGGNMPVGAIAGRRQFMDTLDGGYWQFGDFSVPEAGVTYFAGTFVRHPLMMAAMKEVLLYLKKEGKPLYDKLNGMTQRLVDEVNAHAKKLNTPFKLVTFGSLFKAKWETEPAYTELLFALMRYKGVHIMDGFPCFLTLAFTDADVDFVVRCYRESLDELVNIGFIPSGSKPETVSVEEKLKSNGSSQNGNMPPVPGAKLGKDANGKPGWFVPDPDRPGKYLQVKIN